MWTDRAGFLPLAHELEFDGGCLAPVDDHAEALALVVQSANRDGYAYPQAVLSWRDRLAIAGASDPDAFAERLPRRPAPVFKLPASHTIRLHSPNSEEPRLGDAGFVIQLVGALYGHRMQFHDWWFDSRVPVTRPTINVGVFPQTASRLLDIAYSSWRRSTAGQQRALTNIAYMHSRAGCYEAHWESFTIEYMVTDAIYHLCLDSGQASPCRHADRIALLCNLHGLHEDAETVAKIVRLRNELFHEALWDGSHPGYESREEARVLSKQLRCLNHRLICTSVGWWGDYVRSDWTNWRAPFAFD